jgi:hypothetical protein
VSRWSSPFVASCRSCRFSAHVGSNCCRWHGLALDWSRIISEHLTTPQTCSRGPHCS